MKNGLVSKLKKLALVPLLSFVINATNIQAQDANQEMGLKFDGNIGTSVGYADYGKYSSDPLIPCADWEKHFSPSTPWPMHLTEGKNVNLNGDVVLNIGLATKLKLWKFAIGPVAMLNYSTSTLKELIVNWWDPVTAKRRDCYKSESSFGISADFYLDELDNTFISTTFSTHKFYVIESDYRGIDIFGGFNRSYPMDPKVIGETDGWRISSTFYFRKKEDYQSHAGIGAYFEKDGENIFSAGIVLDWRLYAWQNQFFPK